MTSPHKLVEHAIEASDADQCMVVLQQSSSANLRWAVNTLTTNGIMAASRMTVISVVGGHRGQAVGVLSRTTTTRSQVESLVAEADEAARSSGPAEDAAPLVEGGEAADWGEPAGGTSLEVLETFGASLGEAFDRARSAGHVLYGYVEHDVTTTYLGNTAGLRLRHEQPTGHVGITGKPADLSASAWVGQAVEQLGDVDVADLDAELVRRLGWAKRTIELPAGRYDTLLPPTAVADLAIYAYFVASGRDAHEGQTVFSDPTGGTRVGQEIVRPDVTLSSDPAAEGLSAAPFALATSSSSAASVFDNGLPLTRTDWIRDGRLTALQTSRHTSELTGLATTPVIEPCPERRCRQRNRGRHGRVLVRPRAASDVPVVHPGGGSADTSAHRVDPRRCVRGGEGRGRGSSEQLPVQREPHRPARAIHPSWRDRAVVLERVGRLLPPPRTATPALWIPDFNMSSVSQAS